MGWFGGNKKPKVKQAP
jgi:leucine-rich repeat protein SHOC2